MSMGATGMFVRLIIKSRDKLDILHNIKVTNKNRLKSFLFFVNSGKSCYYL